MGENPDRKLDAVRAERFRREREQKAEAGRLQAERKAEAKRIAEAEALRRAASPAGADLATLRKLGLGEDVEAEVAAAF